MSKKAPETQQQDLQQAVQSAQLAGEQADRMELLQVDEAARASGYTEQRDLANQLLGQVQMANSFSKLATVVSLMKLDHVKKNKLYRALKGKKGVDADGSEIADVGTWDGYCRALGSSASKVDEDLRNLSEFGEQALEALGRAGVGYRELRKLRKIPSEERELIINGEAVRSGDKEAIAEMIDEMTQRHSKEKDQLKRQLSDTKQDLEAQRRVNEKKSQRVTELETQLERAAALSPDEREKELSRRLETTVASVCDALLEPEAVISEICQMDSAPRDLTHACAQVIARLRIRLDEVQARYQLPVVDLDFDDSWIDGEG
ncbi:hypothetical protein [Aquisalimonas asiatica]|uniref:Uncharacterized protein n=1 Tax=Aquisalimonas asiatica TaxID=406100 RepID=A0A1H8RST2_9GAMM|nr:hypothetical protein [Aquisalimonas asiatica]SEO69412.1 hypothetical protein SAMN04488052_102226 [Aquisalimonas asiatica]